MASVGMQTEDQEDVCEPRKFTDPLGLAGNGGTWLVPEEDRPKTKPPYVYTTNMLNDPMFKDRTI